jgi:hypothetical protein
VLALAVASGTGIGVAARVDGGLGWIAALLLCAAAIVAIAQQTLP